MSVTTMIELPSRFTLPALAELKRSVDGELLAGYAVVLDGKAVTSVDSAALQLILVLQRTVDSLRLTTIGNTRTADDGKPHEGADELSVLRDPSPTLVNALLAHGALDHEACLSTINS